MYLQFIIDDGFKGLFDSLLDAFWQFFRVDWVASRDFGGICGWEDGKEILQYDFNDPGNDIDQIEFEFQLQQVLQEEVFHEAVEDFAREELQGRR